MPFCPKCRYEYRDGINRCPDCDETLVAVLPPKSEFDQEEIINEKDWVPLVRLTSVQYAQMIVEEMRAKNIPIIMRSESGHFSITGQMGTMSFNSAGRGFVLLVPREFVEQADTEGEAILGEVWTKSRLTDGRDRQ